MVFRIEDDAAARALQTLISHVLTRLELAAVSSSDGRSSHRLGFLAWHRSTPPRHRGSAFGILEKWSVLTRLTHECRCIAAYPGSVPRQAHEQYIFRHATFLSSPTREDLHRGDRECSQDRHRFAWRRQPSNCPRGFSNNCRSPVMFATGTVWFFDTIAALPSYGAGRLNSAIPMNGFAGRSDVPPRRQSAPAPSMPDGRRTAQRCFRAPTGGPH